MKKSLLIVVIAGLTSGFAMAEVPTKPTYANSSLSTKKANDELQNEVKDEKGSKEGSRAMLKDSGLEEKKTNKNNVLKKTKAGRLAESNRHLDK